MKMLHPYWSPIAISSTKFWTCVSAFLVIALIFGTVLIYQFATIRYYVVTSNHAAIEAAVKHTLYKYHPENHMLTSTHQLIKTIHAFHANIDAVSVHREWPHTMRVVVTIAQDVPLAHSTIHNVCTDQQKLFNKYRNILHRMLALYQLRATKYTVSCAGAVTMQIKDTTFKFGNMQDMPYNITILKHILYTKHDHLANIQYIDMRYEHGFAIKQVGGKALRNTS